MAVAAVLVVMSVRGVGDGGGVPFLYVATYGKFPLLGDSESESEW